MKEKYIKYVVDKSRKIIPAGTEKITKDMFKNHDYSAQESLALPCSVTEIEKEAFDEWKKLNKLIFFCDITDLIRDNLIAKIKDQLKNVIIGGNVELICDSAFKDCSSLESVTIGDKVICIGNEAFSGCTPVEELILNCNITDSIRNNLIAKVKAHLKNVIIGDNVELICDSAFKDCSSLESITIGNQVIYIGDNAFLECKKVEKLIFNCNIKGSIIKNLTQQVKTTVQEISITNKVSVIGVQAFKDFSNLKAVHLPESIQIIADHAFNKCKKLQNVYISCTTEDDFETALYKAHENCSYPQKKIIGIQAFADCTELTTLILPKRLNEIQSRAFANCKKLLSMTIPKKVNRLGSYVFDNCTNLKTISILSKSIFMEGWLWDNKTTNNQCTFIVKSEKMQRVVQKLGNIDSTARVLIY